MTQGYVARHMPPPEDRQEWTFVANKWAIPPPLHTESPLATALKVRVANFAGEAQESGQISAVYREGNCQWRWHRVPVHRGGLSPTAHRASPFCRLSVHSDNRCRPVRAIRFPTIGDI